MCKAKSEGGKRCEDAAARLTQVQEAVARASTEERELSMLQQRAEEDPHATPEYERWVEESLVVARERARRARQYEEALKARLDGSQDHTALSTRKRWGKDARNWVSAKLTLDERLFQFDDLSVEEVKTRITAPVPVPTSNERRALEGELSALVEARKASKRGHVTVDDGGRPTLPGNVSTYQPGVPGRKSSKTGAARSGGRFSNRAAAGASARIGLTDEEHEQVKANADACGLTVSDYLRRRLLGTSVWIREPHQGIGGLTRMLAALRAHEEETAAVE